MSFKEGTIPFLLNWLLVGERSSCSQGRRRKTQMFRLQERSNFKLTLMSKFRKKTSLSTRSITPPLIYQVWAFLGGNDSWGMLSDKILFDDEARGILIDC